MRQINGVYTQRFNRRHHRGGHVFQGRFMAIMVEREVYLLELARYIVLNPVRAGMHKPHTSIAGAAIGPLPGWPLPLTGSGWIGCWDSSPSPRWWRGVAIRRLCKRGSVPRASGITSGSRSIWAASGSLLGNRSGYHKIGTGARYLGLNVGYPSSRLEPMLKRTKIAVQRWRPPTAQGTICLLPSDITSAYTTVRPVGQSGMQKKNADVVIQNLTSFDFEPPCR